EGRLFKPLAYTKTLAMALAALLAITLDPAVRMLFTRMKPLKNRLLNAFVVGRYYPEEKHPVSRVLFWLYEKPCRLVLRWPKTVIVLAVLIVLSTVPVYLKLGHEFMPPLNEGTILYMPTTLPGISVTEAARLMQIQDRTLKSFPEVASVHGKAGRADTATDPAPFSMMETVVQLKPKSQWRHGMTWEKLIAEMDSALQIPGNVNAWTMPIKGRIDMLTTGVRTPVGIKILGANLDDIQRIGEKIEAALRNVPGTRSVFAERAAGGFFVDIVPKREALARYGLTIDDVHGVLMSAIGGETVATTIEGRERYSINLRYPRDLRAELDQLERVLVKTMMGRQVPLVEVADIKLTTGPSMIRDENGKLAGYVYVDVTGRDIGSYVEEAKKAVAGVERQGYELVWSGQYENMIRVRERLKIVVPVTIALIFLLLFMNTKSAFKTLVVMLAVPFSLVGAVWLLYLLGYNVSIAVWVGMIALMGLDAETGVFMLLFLDLSYDEAKRAGKLRDRRELEEAIIYGAVKRIRPKLMTVAAAMMGLMPIMWSVGAGADMMKRIAAPMVGGLATSFAMELLVYPAIYLLWKRRSLGKILRPTEGLLTSTEG
ncbi:MAG: efflux RND transporter permease subunit, partial [Verrucomicrobiota bacterium]